MREVAARRRMQAFFTRYFAYIQRTSLDFGFASAMHAVLSSSLRLTEDVFAGWVWHTNQARLAERGKAAHVIQTNYRTMKAYWRAHVYWQWYIVTVRAVTRVQAWFRGARVVWRYRVKLNKIRRISPWWRCWHQRGVYVFKKTQAMQIQKIMRGALVRMWYPRVQHAATVLANAWRLAKSWRFVEVSSAMYVCHSAPE